ncbi:hypothetical protein SBRY_40259 [Actinacidiphila bryophytorum]|uniref:Uncharacterized protein n=1 Tax=Actinacidiphila bryophytorum TaxID=1436133 RepID=A0A9W4H2L9_9ACTN|nr:hypothetical protein SBRY_40259 [Actinacidiphila bryophytorum]
MLAPHPGGRQGSQREGLRGPLTGPGHGARLSTAEGWLRNHPRRAGPPSSTGGPPPPAPVSACPTYEEVTHVRPTGSAHSTRTARPARSYPPVAAAGRRARRPRRRGRRRRAGARRDRGRLHPGRRLAGQLRGAPAAARPGHRQVRVDLVRLRREQVRRVVEFGVLPVHRLLQLDRPRALEPAGRRADPAGQRGPRPRPGGGASQGDLQRVHPDVCDVPAHRQQLLRRGQGRRRHQQFALRAVLLPGQLPAAGAAEPRHRALPGHRRLRLPAHRGPRQRAAHRPALRRLPVRHRVGAPVRRLRGTRHGQGERALLPVRLQPDRVVDQRQRVLHRHVPDRQLVLLPHLRAGRHAHLQLADRQRDPGGGQQRDDVRLRRRPVDHRRPRLLPRGVAAAHPGRQHGRRDVAELLDAGRGVRHLDRHLEPGRRHLPAHRCPQRQAPGREGRRHRGRLRSRPVERQRRHQPAVAARPHHGQHLHRHRGRQRQTPRGPGQFDGHRNPAGHLVRERGRQPAVGAPGDRQLHLHGQPQLRPGQPLQRPGRRRGERLHRGRRRGRAVDGQRRRQPDLVAELTQRRTPAITDANRYRAEEVPAR